MLTLRDYQREAIDGLFAYWAEEGGNPLLVVPTGGGKSLILAQLCQEILADWPDMRIAIVTHIKELIQQNYTELMGLWPWAPAGIYSAGLKRRETHTQIVFAGIQSIWNKTQRLGHVDLLLIDEAHLIPRKAGTTYGKFIAGLRAINPDMRVVGLTATPYRLDSGRLDEGDDRLFDAVAYEVPVPRLLDEGYLSPPVSKATATALDVTGVGMRGGEFIASELQKAVNKADVTAAAIDEVLAYGQGRRAWLLFCSGVEHAYAVRDELRRRGVSAETLEGALKPRERDRIVADFRAGRFRALTNVSITTTGFNVPQIDLLALLRPTKSTGLYVQMIGRGLRLAEGKKDCVVLDFAKNVWRHGPIDTVQVHKPGKGGGEPPVKMCDHCHSLVAIAARVCPDCGHEFPIDDDPKIERQASAAPILSKADPAWVQVRKREFRRHEKFGGPPSMLVEYVCGLVPYRAWVCFEHDGFARQKAEKFWRDNGGRAPIPSTVDEALARTGELLDTEEIRIRANGKYWEVVATRSRRSLLVEAAE